MPVAQTKTLEETTNVGRKPAVRPKPSGAPHARFSTLRTNRWGVILAGGDGTRSRGLTRLICGDDRPNQFCPLPGDETPLEQTRKRAEQTIPGKQILVRLTKTHRDFYFEELGISPAQRIVQPSNKGTAPPIVYSLLSIEAIDKDAVVAILPCDHHYADEPGFTDALESAFQLAEKRSDSVVLLGARPHSAEVEYGWIELGATSAAAGCVSFDVQGFCEKPSFLAARKLFESGSLWNTFVMVGHVRGFLEIVSAALPDLVAKFRQCLLWNGSEVHIEDALYETLSCIDFSREVLSRKRRDCWRCEWKTSAGATWDSPNASCRR